MTENRFVFALFLGLFCLAIAAFATMLAWDATQTSVLMRP